MAIPLLPGTQSNERDAIRCDPFEAPDEALAVYNKHDNILHCVDTNLLDFLHDQCQLSTCVLDIETTELIDTKRVSISAMTVSVASLLLIEHAHLFTFWNNVTTRRGAPLRFLLHALDHALRIVAYNGHSFDLVVLAQSDTLRLERWRAKLFDPFVILRNLYNRSFKLSALLCANGLEDKTASGAEAPAMYNRWLQKGDESELQRLEEYNTQDVVLLAQLVQLPRVHLPDHGRVTEAVKLTQLPVQQTMARSLDCTRRRGREANGGLLHYDETRRL